MTKVDSQSFFISETNTKILINKFLNQNFSVDRNYFTRMCEKIRDLVQVFLHQTLLSEGFQIMKCNLSCFGLFLLGFIVLYRGYNTN